MPIRSPASAAYLRHLRRLRRGETLDIEPQPITRHLPRAGWRDPADEAYWHRPDLLIRRLLKECD